DRRVRAGVVGGEVVDDRVAADLLLAVAGEAQVDRERVRLDELLRRLEQDEDLALVVGDAARVRPAVPHRQLERLALPEVERRGRLHVEVAVAEDRGRPLGVAGRRDLAQRELLLAERGQLGGAPDPADELADPLPGALHVLAVRRVGTHARNRDELTELVAPGLVHGARLYASRARPGGVRRRRGASASRRAPAASSGSGSRSGGCARG